VPESHFLEDWGDARAFDGTVSILQPLILPLYDSHSYLQVLEAIVSYPGRPAYEIVRSYWTGRSGARDFDAWWRKSLHDGLVETSALPQIRPAVSAAAPAATQSASGGIEVVFRTDPYIYDGRYANNTWLQELPRPMTKLTWDNAMLMSPATAKRLGIRAQE